MLIRSSVPKLSVEGSQFPSCNDFLLLTLIRLIGGDNRPVQCDKSCTVARGLFDQYRETSDSYFVLHAIAVSHDLKPDCLHSLFCIEGKASLITRCFFVF